MRIQGSDGLLRRLNFRDAGPKCLGDGPIVAAAQFREEPCGNVHSVGDVVLPAAQLKHQALRQIPGAHTGRLQGLNRIQCLIHHGLGDFHLRQAVQILLRQISVLVHQLRHIFTQGQHGLRQSFPFQLIAEKRRQAVQLLISRSRLRWGILLMGKGGPKGPRVQPTGFLTQLRVGRAKL